MDYRPPRITSERPCPFCEGKEDQTPPETYALRSGGSAPNGPGWQARSILSQMPMLAPEEDGGDSHGLGIYDMRAGVGHHEVIIETPRHQHDLDEFSDEQVEKVLRVYASRIYELEKDDRVVYPLLFKNHGLISGAATDVIRHSRSQLVGLPIIPKRAKEELQMTKNYFERRERCVFCDILKQESADRKRVVVENGSFFAYCPFASRSPFEMWILPKKHSADFAKLEEGRFAELAGVLRQCLVRLRDLLEDPPYNLILHTAPFRHKSHTAHWKTLELDYHWYLQIMPRLTQSAGFEWGTGIHINPTPPEEAAQLLRDVPQVS
jgi:UDPglucose--hexose-1-phosphate uridylyltransferase